GGAECLRRLGDGADAAIPARVLSGVTFPLERHPEDGAIGARHEGAARAEDGRGQRHDPEGGRARVEQPPRKKQRGAHEDRAAIADAIGEIAGGKLAEDHGEAEDGLEDHDVGERHADLVLPEERDDGNGKEKELARRVGDEEPNIFHGAATFMEPRRASTRRERAWVDVDTRARGRTRSSARVCRWSMKMSWVLQRENVIPGQDASAVWRPERRHARDGVQRDGVRSRRQAAAEPRAARPAPYASG